MLTTTRPSRLAMRAPSYMPFLPEPLHSAPPWIHTNTGSAFAPAGVHTFRLRQSSPELPKSSL